MVTMMTSREFNQKTSAAKKAARSGPVIVTDRGTPEHVLLTYDQYEKMAGKPQSLAEFFQSLPDISDIDAEFPRSRELPRAAVFD